jgi:hypothetical protein
MPWLVDCFPAVSKLALKCDRHTESVGDPTLALIVDRLGPGLCRLKLRFALSPDAEGGGSG